MANNTLNTPNINLFDISVDIEDSSFLSTYFNISEFHPTFGAGKNLLVVNTTELLSSTPNIKIQAVDGNNSQLFIDSAIINNVVSGTQMYYYSVYVDDTVVDGPGKLAIVGYSSAGKLVRWTANIVISTNTETKSKIVFTNKPKFVVLPIITNTLSSFVDINPKTISGSCYSFPVNPPKDFDITNNYDKTNLDYRLISPNAAFTDALVNFPIILNVNSIQGANTKTPQDVTDSTSILVKSVVNDTTLQLSDPYIYQNNKIATILSASYTCSYNNVNYTSASFLTSSYATQSTDLAGGFRYVKNSYALIGYANLDTFAGKIQRHKIYKKDLSTAGGFELVTDELFSEYEMFVDITTPNKTFENLGTFYSPFHINNFWFTSSNAFTLNYDTTTLINSMMISASSPITNGYIIAKPNSSFVDRNATYIPFDDVQNKNFSGSAFDSNFLHFYPNESYTVTFNAAFLNKELSATASFDLYITSSNSTISNEVNYVHGKGVNIGTLSFSDGSPGKIYDALQSYDFSFLNDTYGALVIYPRNFTGGLIANLSITSTAKFGYSQGVYFSKFPFDVNKPNDIFEIKAELYDKDGVLAYSDLDTVQYFDPSGSTTPISISAGTSITAQNLSASNLIVTGNSMLYGLVGGITQLSATGITSSLNGTASWATNLNLNGAVAFNYSSSTTPTTSTTIMQNPTGSYNGAFFDYVLISSSNFRAGTVVCAFSGSNVSYTEYNTTNFGNTSQVTMSALVANSQIELQAITPIGQNWYTKAFGRFL